MITSADEVGKWVGAARERGHIALDTEFVWERTYYPRLGIVQIGLSKDECGLIDAVALPDLGGLGAVLADPSVVKILHDAGQDLTILRRATGAYPVNVFDTRCVAGLVGVSSTQSLTDLVQQTTGVKLTGTATRTDWLRRPLSERQVAYALDDARYLPQAREVLLGRARELGRDEWVREELAAYDEPTQYDDPDPWVQSARLKGASRLSARQQGVLRELAAWREMEAGRQDIPRKHVVPDEVLTAAASRNVRSEQALGRIKGAFDRERYGGVLLEAVGRGHALDEDALPVRPERQDDDEIVNARVDFVLAYLKGKSLNLAVDPALIASRAEMSAREQRPWLMGIDCCRAGAASSLGMSCGRCWPGVARCGWMRRQGCPC